MAEIFAKKLPGGMFALLGEDGERFINRVKVGATVLFNAKVPRNAGFHRKIFGLLKFSFDNWDAPEIEWKGKKCTKSFNRFRKDLIIQAGFWELVVSINGESRAEADSISYARCSQEKAEEIYTALLPVVANQIFNGEFTPERLDELTTEWLGFN